MTPDTASDLTCTRDEAEDSGRRELLTLVSSSNLPFLVGGTHALRQYTDNTRRTKDLDLFILPRDVVRVLDLFGAHGFRVELPFPHWLGKIHRGDQVTDVIFSSGNGVATVDESWFAHARYGDVCGVPVRLCPPEEMIWSKAFVQERERFDGADVLHLLRFLGGSLDWKRLLQRFEGYSHVLLAHLVMFDFVYPDQRHQVPDWVIGDLMPRFLRARSERAVPICNGTLLSREQYLDDVEKAGYWDGRLEPVGRMTQEEIDIWTAGIEEKP
jgi:hypothetical protein